MIKLIVLITSVLVGSLMLLAGVAVNQDKEEKTYQTQHKCQFVSKTETDRTRTCGKACNRPEIKETYQCDNGPLYYLR